MKNYTWPMSRCRTCAKTPHEYFFEKDLTQLIESLSRKRARVRPKKARLVLHIKTFPSPIPWERARVRVIHRVSTLNPLRDCDNRSKWKSHNLRGEPCSREKWSSLPEVDRESASTPPGPSPRKKPQLSLPILTWIWRKKPRRKSAQGRNRSRSI